jgi:hypothetical protein
MFVGNSPEELELAGEEAGSWLDTVKAAVAPITSFVSTPGGKVAAKMLFPETAAAYEAAQAVQQGVRQAGAKGGSAKQAPPSGGGGSAKQAPPSGGGDITPDSSSGWTPFRRGSGNYHYTDLHHVMGAAPPMSDRELLRLINNEPNPTKRQRMIINFQRSKMR